MTLLPFYYTILQCYMSDYRESGPPGIQNRGPGTPGSGRRDPDLGPLHVMFKNKSEGARSYNRPPPLRDPATPRRKPLGTLEYPEG